MASDGSNAPPGEVIAAVQSAVFESLPGLASNEMVDLLEFIATQHTGRSFNPDNLDKALEIAAFCQERPFPVSDRGVGCLARLARHALGSSNGQGNSAEHQLWLLASGALNTAAAILAHDGDAVRFFNAAKSDGVVRGKYMQRLYAKDAMSEHLSKPHAFNNGAPPPAEKPPPPPQLTGAAALNPCQLWFAAVAVFAAILVGVTVKFSDAPNPLGDVYARAQQLVRVHFLGAPARDLYEL